MLFFSSWKQIKLWNITTKILLKKTSHTPFHGYTRGKFLLCCTAIAGTQHWKIKIKIIIIKRCKPCWTAVWDPCEFSGGNSFDLQRLDAAKEAAQSCSRNRAELLCISADRRAQLCTTHLPSQSAQFNSVSWFWMSDIQETMRRSPLAHHSKGKNRKQQAFRQHAIWSTVESALSLASCRVHNTSTAIRIPWQSLSL